MTESKEGDFFAPSPRLQGIMLSELRHPDRGNLFPTKALNAFVYRQRICFGGGGGDWGGGALNDDFTMSPQKVVRAYLLES